MSQQVNGMLGKAVDAMIRRSVKRGFHNVYWVPPDSPVREPAIFVPNHHGWHDGYLMYLALSALGLQNPFHDWIQEFDAFPLFGRIGGMPFPAGDPGRRAATIRRTIKGMKEERRNLMLFAEATLHRPPELLPFGRSLELVARRVPGASVVPVAIRYELSLHERPEATLLFGAPMPPGQDLSARTRLEVAALLDRLAAILAFEPERRQILHRGTPDVNERMDMRNLPRFFRRTK